MNVRRKSAASIYTARLTKTDEGSGLRVLVADDDPAIRMLVQRVFARRGYEVTTANDGADAIVLRVAPAISAFKPARSVGRMVESKGEVVYGNYLKWREILPTEPPRRPGNAGALRGSGSASAKASHCSAWS